MKSSRALWGALLLTGLLAAATAEAYRFFGSRVEGVRSSGLSLATAARWDEARFRFHLLENDNLPTDFDITHAEWTEITRRGIEPWNQIEDAEIEIELAEAPVAADQADAFDGLMTIGFSALDHFRDSWTTGFAAARIFGGQLVDCDIELSPYYTKNWAPQDPKRLIEIVLIHEVGHCLGLGHSEPYPMPLWTDLPVTKDPAFVGDPIMSYSNIYGTKLSPDEIIGASLLYPTVAYTGSYGSVAGVVEIEDGPATRPASFAYLQAIRPGGADAGPGPGVFADFDGSFRLDGLEPGDWMLWIHPVLVVRRAAHTFVRTAEDLNSLDFRDQWRWVRVGAGEVVEDFEVVVQPGREVTQ